MPEDFSVLLAIRKNIEEQRYFKTERPSTLEKFDAKLRGLGYSPENFRKEDRERIVLMFKIEELLERHGIDITVESISHVGNARRLAEGWKKLPDEVSYV